MSTIFKDAEMIDYFVEASLNHYVIKEKDYLYDLLSSSINNP